MGLFASEYRPARAPRSTAYPTPRPLRADARTGPTSTRSSARVCQLQTAIAGTAGRVANRPRSCRKRASPRAESTPISIATALEEPEAAQLGRSSGRTAARRRTQPPAPPRNPPSIGAVRSRMKAHGMNRRQLEQAFDEFFTTKATGQRPGPALRQARGRSPRRPRAPRQPRRRRHRRDVDPAGGGRAMSNTRTACCWRFLWHGAGRSRAGGSTTSDRRMLRRENSLQLSCGPEPLLCSDALGIDLVLGRLRQGSPRACSSVIRAAAASSPV